MKFNITKFKQAANKSMKKGAVSKNTMLIYRNCLMNLNKVLDDNATSSEIRDAILDRGNSAKDHKHAVSWYEKNVNGGDMMTPSDKAAIKEEEGVKELEYSPRYYRERIRKAKYKFAFMVQIKAGLRVSEVAALEPGDFEINGDEIIINVRKGKGGKQRYVHVLPSTYLLEEIPKFEKMPSVSALKAEAARLGFDTHDLRRVNARDRFWRERKKGLTRKQAAIAIKDELGHKSHETTKRYLGMEYRKKKNDLKY